ncbi:polysaccharide deacetylase family protein [Halalkalibacter alkaliphilus]|uniref:Polysaccharide deacetylase n=1 Tax=Halalkalibacter alkaliphilus TaxID=2917993 RepID=A0A9X2I9R8_9BACI|nr:polysaccharide deacetylase [Halalkalibacter alkaliphilus]MCL7749604.1 polysaccharide deacetylase [Halalkalibacter alkaliphilus]
MNQGTVCLTFDFDAISIWLSRNLTSPTPVSRGEFGVVAVPRILHLLEKKGIKTTWFIPGHTIDTYPDVCKEIARAGHEVALHGYAHENNTKLDAKTEEEILIKSLDSFRNILNVEPKGYRAPAWDFSPHTVGILQKYQISYDSSLMGHDYQPFYCRTGDNITWDKGVEFGEETDIVELPVSWSLDDYPQFEYVRMENLLMPGLRSADSVFENWTDDVRYMLRDFENGVLVATFHPQVIGRGHRMLGLEKWLDELQTLPVRFERMDTICEKVKSGDIFGKYNPI